jgi:hypothetical protein
MYPARDSAFWASMAATRAPSLVPTVNPDNVAPHSEVSQAAIWHLVVSHPELKGAANEMGVCHFMTRRAVFLDRNGVLNRALLRKGLP